MSTATLEPKLNTGVNLVTNTDQQALIMFDLTNPFIAELVEDILDASEAMARLKKSNGKTLSFEEVKANVRKHQAESKKQTI